MKFKDQLEKSQKQIKNLQGQKEKVAHYSEVVRERAVNVGEFWGRGGGFVRIPIGSWREKSA